MSRIDKGVLIFNEWFEAMENISDRDCGRLIKAIYRYQILGEEPPIFKGKAEILANVVFPCIERRKKRSVAGKLGYQAKLNLTAENCGVASSKGVRSGTPLLTLIEKNSKEKNSTVKSSEFIGQADVVGRADEGSVDGEAVKVGAAVADMPIDLAEKYAPYHIKRARGKYENVFLSDVEYDEIRHLIFNADAYIDQFSEKLHDKGYRFADHYGALRDWWERDKKLPQYNVSQGFATSAAERERPRARTEQDDNLDRFFEAAVKRSLGGGVAFSEKSTKEESD